MKKTLKIFRVSAAVVALIILIAAFTGCALTDLLFERGEQTTGTSPGSSSPDSETDQITAGQGTGTEAQSASETSEIVIIPYTTATEAEPEVLYPDNLTGLSYAVDYTKKRPVSIVIDNLSTATPQTGISRADILIECLAEGGITRLILITNKYQSNEVYGPVRSTRDYMVSLSRSFGTLMVGGGFSPTGEQMIVENTLDYIDGVHDKYALSGFFRDPSRYKASGYEHSLMITGQGIIALAGINNYAVSGSFEEPAFKFASEPVKPVYNATAAEHIVLSYSEFQKVQMVYSRSENVYYRYQFGTRPHLDAETGEQLRFENVLVLFAQHTSIPGDDAGRISVGVTGSGTGYYAACGQASEIVWSRVDDSSPLVIKYPSGAEVTFCPGKTMISVFPEEYKEVRSRFNINLVSS